MNDSLQKSQFKLLNFEKAFNQLNYRFDVLKSNPEDEIVQTSVIQTFEFTFELAWKLLKSFLEYKGVVVESYPRDVIKVAFQNNLISNGETWLNALEDRNKTSHTYNSNFARQMVTRIIQDYQAIFTEIFEIIKLEYDIK